MSQGVIDARTTTLPFKEVLISIDSNLDFGCRVDDENRVGSGPTKFSIGCLNNSDLFELGRGNGVGDILLI